VIDLVEAVVLSGREGERFDAVVIDEGLVALREPAVRARVDAGAAGEPGRDVVVRLDHADPAARTVAFSLVTGARSGLATDVDGSTAAS
jgi:RNase II-type exonuclease C-terminal S1 domain